MILQKNKTLNLNFFNNKINQIQKILEKIYQMEIMAKQNYNYKNILILEINQVKHLHIQKLCNKKNKKIIKQKEN